MIADYKKGLLHVCALNGNLLKSINPDGCLQEPIGICVGTKNSCNDERIYIYDSKAETVFLFNQDFKLIKKNWRKIKGNTIHSN